ncbi:MAG: LrgB family protein [Bacillaceae bacterium]
MNVLLLSCIITIGVYLLSRKVSTIYKSPFTTPVFFSTIVIIIIFSLLNITIEQYEPAKEILTFLLGPATVALAIPLYRNRHIIVRYWKSAGLGLMLGTLSTIIVAVLTLKIFIDAADILVAMSVKSITVPVALEVSKGLGGNTPLTTAFVVFTGTVGTMFGPWLMNVARIDNPIARGLSLGTLSHGQGTAQAMQEGEIQGAVAGVAMGLAAIFTSLIIPVIIPFFI